MNTSIYKNFKTAILILLIFTVITGIIYPCIITGIAQYFFSEKANGSLIIYNNKNAGSALIGQNFDSPKYFWGRPSATEIFPYNTMDSKGSGLSPANPDFIANIKNKVKILQKIHGINNKVPIELVEASASGIDPHISPMAAIYQIHRVAKARGLKENAVRKLVDAHIEDRQFGVLGEARINVLKLNLSLDMKKKHE
jgi:potassium-transporting ATPase KdpC subunit